ncbi:N-acetylmuramoyl-L-alanine amidase [Thermocatellispora tengchongensis]|uniref:N-acetylmuramoyl-L-alanine amidase n=1 Tax=Thermocatellispora tengchongensis TaxID=1073253 RepID=A0A840PRN1_9ACTN|nr:N-acetylmuramoyl-L-alanine amidase [Thermocatellispora tengchongensis]MBB5138625.1 N-acetylmuramoyl-L-alanine amidase [Thermocatellispora tengchongensis]
MKSRAVAAALLALGGLTATACGGTANGAATAPPSATRGGPEAQGVDAAERTSPAEPAAPQPGSGAGSDGAGRDGAGRDGAGRDGDTAAKPLAGKVVVIDPGHNGLNYKRPDVINRPVNVLTKRKPCDTTGTSTGDGYSEAAFTWDVSQRLAKLLRAQGATVKLTRSDNSGVGPCITERAAIGNRAKADAAISVHADGARPSDRGFHVIMPKKINGPVDKVVGASRRLGIDVRDAFRDGTGLPYSTYIGDKALDFRDDLGGLNLSTVPKVFIECGNMRNPGEAAKFRSASFRQKIARSLAEGVANYLT